MTFAALHPGFRSRAATSSALVACHSDQGILLLDSPEHKWATLSFPAMRTCLLCAMCGRLRVGKSFLHACSIGRCSHVFGLLVRHTGPLAIMPCADQVPVNSSHSTMRWHKWVVLIAGSTGSALRAVRPPNFHITPDIRRDLVYAASATGCL